MCKCIKENTCIYIYIYTYTSELLCVYAHRNVDPTCQVDAIVMLTWSKVCITKAITISITISIQKLSSTSITLSKSYHLWKTGQICGKLARFLENLSDSWKTGQMCKKLVRI